MTGMRFPSELTLSASPIAPPPLLPGRWIAGAVAVSLLIDGALLFGAGLRIDTTRALALFVAWAVIGAAVCILFRRPATQSQRIARDLVEGISLFALVSLLGAIASYPLAAGHHALVDPELERIDLSLHFHWTSWYELAAAHSWLQPIERMAYLSIFVTPALLIGYFAWTGRRADNRLFVATFWIAVLITLALFPFFPAAGPFATLWHGSMPYMPLSGLYQDQVILALREHRIHSVDLGALHGLVCAPSFHAASAVIYIATAYRIAALRWPIAALNIVMLLATPVEGTHYLTDLLSGMAVACIAVWLTPILVRWAARGNAGWMVDLGQRMPIAAE
jgi:membrane-associated phospholipid phosphatase